MTVLDKKAQRKKTFKVVFINIYKVTTILAPIGLLLSILSFVSEARKSGELVKNLTQIEQSLSTRHIGIFPDYLDNINQLLSETTITSGGERGIIIFEDVLFYGAFYNGVAFKEIIRQLSDFAERGKKITIAYYDNTTGRMFREVVQESWIRQQDLRKLAEERRDLRRAGSGLPREENTPRRNIDSIASEKFFAHYRDEDRKEFSQRIGRILVPFYNEAAGDDHLFYTLDSIKNTYLNKPVGTILFNDIYRMYHDITEELKAFFEGRNIQLIPLNNYLTMSCWSNGEKVLFAFPGRFAANEIGFISSDRAILDYIETMLEGVENTLDDM